MYNLQLGDISVVQYKLLNVIEANIISSVSKSMDGVTINTMKMIPDRILINLFDMDETVKCYYYSRITQEKNGILNKCKRGTKVSVKK